MPGRRDDLNSALNRWAVWPSVIERHSESEARRRCQTCPLNWLRNEDVTACRVCPVSGDYGAGS